MSIDELIEAGEDTLREKKKQGRFISKQLWKSGTALRFTKLVSAEKGEPFNGTPQMKIVLLNEKGEEKELNRAINKTGVEFLKELKQAAQFPLFEIEKTGEGISTRYHARPVTESDANDVINTAKTDNEIRDEIDTENLEF